MKYNIITQAEAILDIQTAFERYEKARGGLGFEVIQEIEDCYSKISNNPQYYGFISKRHRSIKTLRFPYSILFEVVGDNVFVDYFLHDKPKRKDI